MLFKTATVLFFNRYIDVYASKSLKATLDGSGDIRYRGEPKVEASIDGAGSIKAD